MCFCILPKKIYITDTISDIEREIDIDDTTIVSSVYAPHIFRARENTGIWMTESNI